MTCASSCDLHQGQGQRAELSTRPPDSHQTEQVLGLQHWEGFHSQDCHAVVVLGATNRRHAVDPAALRRQA